MIGLMLALLSEVTRILETRDYTWVGINFNESNGRVMSTHSSPFSVICIHSLFSALLRAPGPLTAKKAGEHVQVLHPFQREGALLLRH